MSEVQNNETRNEGRAPRGEGRRDREERERSEFVDKLVGA